MHLLSAVACILALLTAHLPNSHATSVNEIYQSIKQLEDSGVFPIPAPKKVIAVGTFNAATGVFTGLTTRVEEMPIGDIHIQPGAAGGVTTTDPPKYIGNYRIVITRIGGVASSFHYYPSVSVDAVRTELKFSMVNVPATGVNISINGEIKHYPGGTQEAIVDAGKTMEAHWIISAGNKSYGDVLEIRRKPIIGGGAFIIPAFPVSLLYEPPRDSEGLNSATYSTQHQLCTETRWAFTETSTTPVSVESVVVPYIGRNDLQTISTAAVGALTVAAVAYPAAASTINATKKAFQKLVGFMDSAFGTARAGATVAESGERGERFVYCQQIGNQLDTSPNNGGPGKGDIFTYLRNARFAWIAANGPVHLVYLGADGTVNTTTSAILAALGSENSSALSALGLTEDSANALLDLNPYVSASTPYLPSSRYKHIDEITMGCGGGQGWSNSFHFGDETVQATYQVVNRLYTETQNAKPGFLSFLGLGVTESVNYKLELGQYNYSGESTSESRNATVDLHCSADETDPYVFNVFVDVIFNTYAVTELSNVGTGPWIKGVAYSQTAQPLPLAKIVLEVGGRRHRTYTNADGEFMIYARNIKPGIASISSPSSRVSFLFNRTRIPSRIELRPEKPKINIPSLKGSSLEKQAVPVKTPTLIKPAIE